MVFRRDSSRAFRAASRALMHPEPLSNALGDVWIFFKGGSELLVDDGLHQSFDLGVAQLCLGLSLKLRITDLH